MALLRIRAGSTGHRVLTGVIALAIAAFLFVLPLWIDDAAQIGTLSQIAAYSVAILGLILLMGYCGQISIGHGAFVGLGAYTTVILVVDADWPFLLTIPVSVVICMAAGAIIGIPALRIQGLYLVTVTLAIAALFPVLVMKFPELTGGANGKIARRPMTVPDWFFIEERSRVAAPTLGFYVIVLITVVMFLLARHLVRSRIGRSMIAVKNSPFSAAASGVPVSWIKVATFSVSAGFAGVAGSLLAIQLPTATDTRFNMDLSIFLLVAVIIGGSRSIWGAIPGAVMFVVLRTYLADWAQGADLLGSGPDSGQIVGVISGLLLLFFVFVLPGGLLDGWTKLRSRLIEVIPAPPDPDDTFATAQSSTGDKASESVATASRLRQGDADRAEPADPDSAGTASRRAAQHT